MIEQALFTLFSTDSNLLAALDGRIYPIRAPQNGELPYCVYERTGTDKLYSSDGPLDLLYCTVQTQFYASTYAGAKELADLARQHEGFTGEVATSGDQSPVTIQYLQVEDEFDDFDPPSADEVGRYSVVIDWRCGWNHTLE